MKFAGKSQLIKTILAFILLCLTALILTNSFSYYGHKPYRYTDFGTTDFIEYWSAFRVLLDGENPYNPELLSNYQIPLGRDPSEPLMMWNPPWTPLIMAPATLASFELGAMIWFICNIALTLLAVVFTKKLIKPSENQNDLAGFLAAIFFIPTWLVMHWGQLALLVICATLASLLALQRNKPFLAGVLLFLTSVKIHLVFLVVTAVGLCWLRLGKWKPIVGGLAMMASMTAMTSWLSSSAVESWVNAITSGESSYHQWYTFTVTSYLKLKMFLWLDDGIPKWTSVVIPTFGLLSTLSYLWLRAKVGLSLFDISILLCLSIIFTPHAWHYDMAVLVPVQICLVLVALNLPTWVRLRLIFLLILIQLVMATKGFGILPVHLNYIWVPFGYLALLCLYRKHLGPIRECVIIPEPAIR